MVRVSVRYPIRPAAMTTSPQRLYVWLLVVLLAAFIGRVAAQLVQAIVPVGWLPPFAAWAAGGLPYLLLLAIQLAIIATLIVIIARLARGRLTARRRWGPWLLGLGAIYFAMMAFRLMAGLSVLADHAWFAAPLPAIFHMVLAVIVLTLGHYHWARGS